MGRPLAVLTLLGLDYSLNRLTGRSRFLRRAIEGEPRLLVHDGRLLTKALREEKVEIGELRAAVREHGVPGSRTSTWPFSRRAGRSA